MQNFIEIIQDAIERDPRSLYKLAQDAELAYSTVHRFQTGERVNISPSTAAKLCQVLGLELRPTRKGR